jgi:hypothetical protein
MAELNPDHINHAFPEETRPMMYKMMKWWGGKPHNIFAGYIERYSKRNEIVLDPFSGRGVSVIEAVISGRKGVGIDLNPMAIFMLNRIAEKLDMKMFNVEWMKIKKDFKEFEDQSGLYQTECKKCGNKKARVVNVQYISTPFQVVYVCKCTMKGKRMPYIIKEIDKYDLKIIEDSYKIQIQYWYPKDKFPGNEAFDIARKEYGETYADFFTKRNLYLLSYIFDRINNVKDNALKNIFKFAFVSMLHLSTMFPAARKAAANRFGAGSWGRPAFLKLKQRLEMNPFVLYERAIEGRQGIISGKTSSKKRIKDSIRWAKSFDDLSKGKNFLVKNKNVLELTDFIPKNSIDYVITDPPYGGLIDYFDLSSLWTVWLKGKNNDTEFEMPFKNEITIDPNRKMDINYYDLILGKAFSQIFEVLKVGRYMTVTFHNKEPRIFNSLHRACVNAGFIPEKVLYQANKRAGETGVSTPWGTSISDFYIRFRKPKNSEQNLEQFMQPDESKFERIVVASAKEVLSARAEATEIAAIIPDLYKTMVKLGLSLSFESDDQIEKILRKNSEIFERVGNTNLWWFTKQFLVKTKMNLIPLSERVGTAVLNTLRAKYRVTFDEILQTIFETFPDSLTPDSDSVKSILEEYAEKAAGGYWKLKPLETEDEEVKMHTQMEINLAKVGKNSGYTIWCADRTFHSDLKALCIRNLDLDVQNLERIKKIDILWIKGKKIKYAFEVENSTSMTSALERCSNLPDVDTKKVIVLPKTREKFFERKMSEPLFSNTWNDDNWSKIWYYSLESFNAKDIEEIME